jgi:hypothetical protein
MQTTVEIEWTVTIETHGVLIMENDAQVTASVSDEGEVQIDQIEIIKYGNTVKHGTGKDVWFTRPIEALIPFSTSDEPWLKALSERAEKALMDDDRLIERAIEQAGLVYVGMGGNDPDGHFKRVRGYA